MNSAIEHPTIGQELECGREVMPDPITTSSTKFGGTWLFATATWIAAESVVWPAASRARAVRV